MKIAVLYTELTAKHQSNEEVSIIVDAENVSKVLNELGHLSKLIPFSINNLTQTTELLKIFSPDLVFNLVDEVDGIFELSHLPASYLSALGYRFTGCNGTSLAITTDKVLTKQILQKNSLPTAPWLCYQNLSDYHYPDKKFLVKHRFLDSSAGLNEDTIQLYSDGPELRKILNNDHNLMAEEYIDGREFAIPVFNYYGEILVPGAAETIFRNYPPDKLKIFGTLSKWAVETFEYENTIPVFNFPKEDQDLIEHLKKLSKECWDILQLSSYTRIDFRVDLNKQPWILEVNGNPSIASHDWFAAVVQNEGINYQKLIQAIVESIES